MTIYSKNITLGLLAILLCMVVSVSFAGTTDIRVETEGSGDINKNTGQQNLNGAMIWNGQEWGVNNTWAHQFFMDTRTGNRLKEYNGKDVTVSGASDTTTALGYGNFYPEETFGNYTITKQGYSYSTPGSPDASATYIYHAVEYVIHDNVTGKDVVLKSRGSGNGTSGG